MKTVKLTMAESIENSKFSTRLKTALKRMADFPQTKHYNLDTVIELYLKDPITFETYFLRIPAAGRVSLDEFKEYADKLDNGQDCTGRTVGICFEEAFSLQDAVGEACNSIDPSTHTYRSLRRLQDLLDAATLHLEQVEDDRPMFHRKADS